MTENILNPVEQFQTYKDKFHEIAEKTFNELTTASGINPEANRALCAEIQDIKSNNEKLSRYVK